MNHFQYDRIEKKKEKKKEWNVKSHRQQKRGLLLVNCFLFTFR